MRLRFPYRLFVVLVLVLPGLPARGQESTRCTCREGHACYHFLNAPVAAPDDPCSCPACRARRGSCPKHVPEGWNPTCAGNNRMECFLRRHAASWGLTCSEMIDHPKCACKTPHPEWCPRCGKNGSEWRSEADMADLRRLMESEPKVLGRRPELTIVLSPHFYVVTDIDRLKLRTQSGSARRAGRHEVAHLYAQRAEQAFDEFTAAFGTDLRLTTRIGIYLLRRESRQDLVAKEYFGLAGLDFIYGQIDGCMVGSGYALDGLAISLDEHPGDHGLHLGMLHNIGHLLMNRWTPTGGACENWPGWVYRGAAQWLSRRPEKFHERAVFHHGEGKVEFDQGEDWWDHLRRQAADPNLPPMQRLLDMGNADPLLLDDHRRVWSWFELFLAEDPEPFLRFLTEMRAGRKGRPALQEAFGCTPEELDQRWKDRILGRRRSLAPTVAEIDAANPDTLGARRRAAIRDATDPDSLSAMVQALEHVEDPLTAEVLHPLLASESDKVRETVVLLLSRGSGPEVRRWLREEGLAREAGPCRAHTARILGQIPDKEAGPALAPYLGDENWLTRAQVARALGRLQYEPSLRALRDLLEDRSSMVRVSVLCALARFGRRAGFAWPEAAKQLNHRTWQVRSAAAECLGALGELAAVDPLLDRMETEGGRIRLDIRAALAKLTGDDLGANPEHWRKWWEREKERFGGVPPPQAMGKPGHPEDENYAPPPTYYGLQVFSRRLAFLVDSSGSMLREFTIDPTWLARNRRDYPPRATRFELVALEVERTLRSLDPRAGFQIMFFSEEADAAQDNLTGASPTNIDRGLSRLRAAKPSTFAGRGSQTNYVDALRLLLDRKRGSTSNGHHRETADTAFFLTDGYPTAGDMTDPELILGWFGDLNEFARIHLNVVAFGEWQARKKFLERLAEQNGGTFVRIPEKK